MSYANTSDADLERQLQQCVETARELKGKTSDDARRRAASNNAIFRDVNREINSRRKQ